MQFEGQLFNLSALVNLWDGLLFVSILVCRLAVSDVAHTLNRTITNFCSHLISWMNSIYESLTTFETLLQVEQNPLLGFGAIAIAVLCSGFAGKS